MVSIDFQWYKSQQYNSMRDHIRAWFESVIERTKT